jgi:hypothetical protein
MGVGNRSSNEHTAWPALFEDHAVINAPVMVVMIGME